MSGAMLAASAPPATTESGLNPAPIPVDNYLRTWCAPDSGQTSLGRPRKMRHVRTFAAALFAVGIVALAAVPAAPQRERLTDRRARGLLLPGRERSARHC